MSAFSERHPRQRHLFALVLFLYVCATLQFVRYYCKTTIFYLNIHAYLNGTERLPFQERVLPIFLIRAIQGSHWFALMAHPNGILTQDLGAFYVISLFGFLIAGIYTQKLYQAVTTQRTLSLLVYPIFLFIVMWTYCIHLEADYSYPYDMLSLAFFTAGLYYIYRRSFIPLFLIILIGTWNRETTLFLVGIYILDVATASYASPLEGISRRFNFRQIPWHRVALLSLTWLGIELILAHWFKHNSRAEDYLRISENLTRLKPRLLPALLNICGYALPLVLLFRHSLRPIRFANYLWIVPFWIAIMFCTGVILETRIYGELCSYCAVALVLILEQNARQPTSADAEELQSEPLVATKVTT
jgi:hypothetical protein